MLGSVRMVISLPLLLASLQFRNSPPGATSSCRSALVREPEPALRLWEPTPALLLLLRGGARRNTHKRKKTMRLNDFKKDDQNEYYAGGLDENGGGSATCLIYPGEEEFDNATAANSTGGSNSTGANASSVEAVEAAPAQKRAYTGSGRSLE